MPIFADFNILMEKTIALRRARERGDQLAIGKAQAAHDFYRDICFRADHITLDVTVGQLDDTRYDNTQ